MIRHDFDALAEKVRNWGRWGEEDQRGTLNLIDPAALQRASAAATQGKLFNLGLNFDSNGPQQSGGFRFNPQHFMTAIGEPLGPNAPDMCYSDDVISMPPQCATQWDAFAHVHYDGELYNGCKACDVLSPKGASRNGIEHLASPGIMSRGILLDVATHFGVNYLDSNVEITPDMLNEVCTKQGVSVMPGDILLVRTGHIQHFVNHADRETFQGDQPGVGPACAEWLYDKGVAALCADNLAVEVLSHARRQQDAPLPLHMFCLRDMGMPLGEMFNLEALAKDCADDGQYQFLLAAPPLAITGGVGSPVNPLVLK